MASISQILCPNVWTILTKVLQYVSLIIPLGLCIDVEPLLALKEC